MQDRSYCRIWFSCLQLLLLFGLLARRTVCWNVAGCRGIDNHDFDDERSSNASDSCYCDPVVQDDDQRRVVIRCLLGSSIDTLSRTVNKVQRSNALVWSIQVGEMDFKGRRMRDNFFAAHNITPEEFSVFSCGTADQFTFGEASLHGALDSLKKFTVFGCKLVNVPPVVRRLSWLEVLELASDEIETLRSGELAGLTQLRTLDLSDNNMVSLERGSLQGLPNLETLILGPGNSLGQSDVQQVGSLHSLIHLKMPKNHLKALPTGCFDGMAKLEELDLSGNFLETLNGEMLRGLVNLRTLDLRVNLISKIEDGAFSELTNLKELYLSGNYITEVGQGTFRNLLSLDDLHLGWNEFAEIGDNAFADLKPLKNLQLNNNRKLMLVEEKAFNQLVNLERLNLSSTKMVTLEPNTFQATPKLAVLDLSNSDIDLLDGNTFKPVGALQELYLNKTHLFTLPEELLAPLEQLRILDISFNPWQCNDNLTWLVDWMRHRAQNVRINRINDTICFWPAQLRGERLISLSVSQMKRVDGATSGQGDTKGRPASAESPAAGTKSPGGFFGSILSSETQDTHTVDQDPAASAERADGGQSSEVGTVIIVVVVILSLLIVLTAIVIVTMMMRKRKRTSVMGKLKNGLDHFDPNQTYKFRGQSSGAAATVPYKAAGGTTNGAHHVHHDSELITRF